MVPLPCGDKAAIIVFFRQGYVLSGEGDEFAAPAIDLGYDVVADHIHLIHNSLQAHWYRHVISTRSRGNRRLARRL